MRAVVDKSAVGRIASLSATVLLGLASPLPAADTYLQASTDQAGQLRIATKDGREIVPKKEAGQVGFDKAAISPDGRSVGWSALYPNCCTSYPIPLKLVIYASGRVRTFAEGLPVWQWCFVAGGKQVAFFQETVHGGRGTRHELREVVTGRLIAVYEPAPEPDTDLRGVPKWLCKADAKQ